MTDVCFRWEVTGDDKTAYVGEYLGDTREQLYGPMPRGLVEAFILERKRAITDIYMRVYCEEAIAPQR